MALVNPQQQMVAPPKASLSGAFQRGAQAIVGARRNALLAQGEGVVRQALRELSDEGVLEPEERQQFELADYGQPEVVGQALSTLSALRKTRRIDKEIEDKVLKAVPAHLGEEQAAEWALTEGALRLSPQAAARFQQTFGWMEDMLGKRRAAATKAKEEDTTAPIFAAFVAEVNDALTDPKLTEDAKRKILLDASKDYPELYGYKPFVDFKNTLDIGTARATAAGGNKATMDVLSEERKFRSEMEPSQKNFAIVQTAYNTIKKLGANPSATDQISLVFAFMKVLDPTSAVRETEYNTAAGAGGITDKLFAKLKTFQEGDVLPETVAQKIVATAEKLYKSKLRDYQRDRSVTLQTARKTAKRLPGFDITAAVPDFSKWGDTFSAEDAADQWDKPTGTPEADDKAMDEMLRGKPKPKGGK